MEEQQLNKDDEFTCTGQNVTTRDASDSIDTVKLENEKESSSSPSSTVDEISEDKNCSTPTDVVLIKSPVLVEDGNEECNDIVNVEENAGYSAQPTSFETQSDLRRKNVLYRAPRYFEPSYESDKSSEEDKKRKKSKKPKNRKRCYNCGDTGHRGPECKHFTACLICLKKGHLIKDCRQINIEVDSNSKLCLKCGSEGHDMFACNSEYISEDLKEIQCYVCKDFGHLCCIEYKTDEPTVVSCYKCGESGHFGSVCSVIKPDIEVQEIFCQKCTRKRRYRQCCSKCNKTRKRAAAAAAALVEATTEKDATLELESAKGKKSLKRKEKKLRTPTVNNVRPIRHKVIWPSPVPPIFGPYYGRPGSNVWINPALAAARDGKNKPQYAPLNWTHQTVTETSRQPLNWNWNSQPVIETSQQPQNWTFQPVVETSRQPLDWAHQPVTETSQQPLNWTRQPVTETSQDPARPFYPFMHCHRETNIQIKTEFTSEMVLPKQSSSHQSTVPLLCRNSNNETVPLPCRNSNNETVNQNCTDSTSLSATDLSQV